MHDDERLATGEADNRRGCPAHCRRILEELSAKLEYGAHPAGSVQAQGLGKSEGDVEVLDGLPGGSLHQIVDAGHHHELPAIG